MIQAVIFDLDGTVLDNEGVWEDIFRQVVKENGIKYELNGPWIHEPGIGIKNNWKRIAPGEDITKLTTQTHKLYADLTAVEDVTTRDGLVELVEEIKSSGLQTALATGSEWVVVEHQIEQLNLYLAFDVTTTGEEIMALKPDPEIFLLTAQKLGLEPNECLVIEDAVVGVVAAREAGCKVVGITGSRVTKTMLEAAGADFVVDNLSEVMVILREHGNKKN